MTTASVTAVSPAAGAAPRDGAIVGILRADGGRLAGQCHIFVQAVDSTGRDVAWFRGCVNARGEFAVRRVPPGRYELYVADDSHRYADRYLGGTSDPATATKLDIRAGTNRRVTVDLHLAGRVAGRLTDASTGRPLTDDCHVGVEISRLADPDVGYVTGCTTGNGRYHIAGVAPGRYLVHFVDAAEGYQGQWWDDTDYANARPVAVKRSVTTEGIDATLSR